MPPAARRPNWAPTSGSVPRAIKSQHEGPGSAGSTTRATEVSTRDRSSCSPKATTESGERSRPGTTWRAAEFPLLVSPPRGRRYRSVTHLTGSRQTWASYASRAQPAQLARELSRDLGARAVTTGSSRIDVLLAEARYYRVC